MHDAIWSMRADRVARSEDKVAEIEQAVSASIADAWTLIRMTRRHVMQSRRLMEASRPEQRWRYIINDFKE